MNKLLTQIYKKSFDEIDNTFDPELYAKLLIVECSVLIQECNINPIDDEMKKEEYWKGYIHASDDAIVEITTKLLTDIWEEKQ